MQAKAALLMVVCFVVVSISMLYLLLSSPNWIYAIGLVAGVGGMVSGLIQWRLLRSPQQQSEKRGQR